jgi:hypothetical protein
MDDNNDVPAGISAQEEKVGCPTCVFTPRGFTLPNMLLEPSDCYACFSEASLFQSS